MTCQYLRRPARRLVLPLLVPIALLMGLGACSRKDASTARPDSLPTALLGRESVADRSTTLPPPALADPDGAPDGAPEASPSAIAPPHPDSVAALTPYFAEAPLNGALKQFQSGKNNTAATVFEAWISAHPDDPRARPARLLSLLARHDGGVYSPTAERLEILAHEWPELSDYAWFYAGSCHLLDGRPDAALSALKYVTDASTLWPRAVELRARAEQAAGRTAAAISGLQAYLDANPRGREEAWARLSILKAASGDAEGALEAKRALAVQFASRPSGRKALKELGKKSKLTAEQELERGRQLFRAQRHNEALAALKTAVKGLKKAPERRCEGLVLIARTYDKLKKHKTAWPWYEHALECSGEPLAFATFSGGRNRRRSADFKGAMRLYKLHLERFPERSTADDVMVQIAALHRRAGDGEAADAVLFEQLERYPEGDYAYEAAWSLLWPLVNSGKWAAVIERADVLLKRMPRDDHYRSEGRTLYWRARAFAELKKPLDAWAGYRAVLTEYPLSWYALMAWARMSDADPIAARTALNEILATPALLDDPLALIPEQLRLDPHFKKAAELARLGLGESAQRELDALPRPASSKDRDAWLWTKISLYLTAGAPHLATRLSRAEEPKFGQYWPVGSMRTLWALSHPRPFGADVSRWAEARGIDPHWIWSIMREESGFNPNVESWASAVGLMQIIMPTAEQLAKGEDIEPTREALKRPEVAIQLGSKYLASLYERHPLHPLASAGYNAGGGAVASWRREFGDIELDLFVERIPYREARGYAKRVTRSLARYRWLYEETDHRAPMRLPTGAPGRPAK